MPRSRRSKIIYWDLVSAYEQTQVNEQSSAFAEQTLENARKQLKLESIPEIDVMRAEAELSRRDQDLTVARTSLQLQETLMMNAVTKNLSDPLLEAMPVIPTDRMQANQIQAASEIQELIALQALDFRPELAGDRCRPAEPPDQRKAARNALLLSLSLVGFYGGRGPASGR